MLKIALLFTVITFLSACSSYYGAAKIISVPAGAQVINDADGRVLGVTPLTAWWKNSSGSREHLILHFKKQNYYAKTSSFWLSMRHKNVDDAVQQLSLVEVTLQKEEP